MGETLRAVIDWDAEIANSININRLKLINTSKATIERQVIRSYEKILKNIVDETTDLFNRANTDGHWNKSKVIRFNRNKKLISEINETLKAAGKDYSRLVRKNMLLVGNAEFNEITSILNDFQLIDSLNNFNPGVTQFRKDILSQDIQGLTYLERSKKISAAQAISMQEQINVSQTLGEGIRKTVARVRKVNDIGLASALRLVRTSTMQTSNLAHILAYERTKIATAWRWDSTLDDRTCPICGMRDQQVFPFEDNGLIPAHFACRCVATPVLPPKEWDKRGTENVRVDQGRTRIARNPATGKNYKVSADDTWRDWFKNQSPDVQQGIIGEGKWNLWEENRIKLEQIAPAGNKQGKIITLKTLTNISNKINPPK